MKRAGFVLAAVVALGYLVYREWQLRAAQNRVAELGKTVVDLKLKWTDEKFGARRDQIRHELTVAETGLAWAQELVDQQRTLLAAQKSRQQDYLTRHEIADVFGRRKS